MKHRLHWTQPDMEMENNFHPIWPGLRSWTMIHRKSASRYMYTMLLISLLINWISLTRMMMHEVFPLFHSMMMMMMIYIVSGSVFSVVVALMAKINRARIVFCFASFSHGCCHRDNCQYRGWLNQPTPTRSLLWDSARRTFVDVSQQQRRTNQFHRLAT